MENQDNINIPINPIQNPNLYSPNRSSPIKIQNFSKNNNIYIYNQSPFNSRLGIYNTPNKSIENAFYYPNYPNLGETPFNNKFGYFNISVSPVNNNTNLSYKKIQNFTEKK